MATLSSCTLTSFSSRSSVPNDTATTLIKTLACYGRGETFCESENLIDFCTPAAEIRCGDSPSANRTVPSSKCHCLGLETCFCSFGCSGSLALLTLYLAFFIYAQIFKKENSTVLNAFNLRRNLSRIFAKVPGESLTCLNWMRALSLMSVVLGHFHQIMTKVHADTDPSTKHSFFSMLLLHNMSLSVDTFLLLGGLLHAYTWVLKAQAGKSPKINLAFWAKFVFQRWYRLAPSLLATIFVSNVIGHVILPEMWMGSADPNRDCSATWWTMVTFTNNIFPNTCMRWLWYLAMDVQLNFLALPFLLSLERFGRRKIVSFCVLLLIASLVYRGYLVYVLEIPIMYLADAPVWESAMQSIYVRVFPRLSPYLIGLLLGAHLDEACVFITKTTKVLQITVFSFVLFLYAYFGGFYEYFYDMDTWHRIFYLSVFRTVFTLSMAWYALMCTSRQVGFFKKLRKFPLWLPIARLSFSAYLVHPMVIGGAIQKLFCNYVPVTVSIDYVVVFGGVLALTTVLCVAFSFSLVLEMPMASLRPLLEKQITYCFSSGKDLDNSKRADCKKSDTVECTKLS